MNTLQLLRLIRVIINEIVAKAETDNQIPLSRDSILVGIAWDIQQILIKHNINEN